MSAAGGATRDGSRAVRLRGRHDERGHVIELPGGYRLRRPSLADVPAAQRVLDDLETYECGEPRRHDNRLEIDFRRPRLDLEHDAWLVTAPPGAVAPLAALGVVWSPHENGEIASDVYVHPEHCGSGLGAALLAAMERRALEFAVALPAGVSGTLVVWAQPEEECRVALDERGFAVVRHFFEMEIGVGGALTAPRWPGGIAVRTLRPGRDERPLHAADTEAFAEHYLFEARSYEEWRQSHIDRADFDPELWLIAWDGDEIAGYAAAMTSADGGFVDDLAVRRPWRGRGLGSALLLAEFRAAGRTWRHCSAALRRRPERDRRRRGLRARRHGRGAAFQSVRQDAAGRGLRRSAHSPRPAASLASPG